MCLEQSVLSLLLKKKARPRILANRQPLGTAQTDQVLAPIREKLLPLHFILEDSHAVNLVANIIPHQTKQLAILGVRIGKFVEHLF